MSSRDVVDAADGTRDRGAEDAESRYAAVVMLGLVYYACYLLHASRPQVEAVAPVTALAAMKGRWQERQMPTW